MMRQKRAIALLMLAALVPACATVQTKSTFYEDTEEIDPETGLVIGTTHTEWTQSARGGPFTDIEKLQQDSLYRSEGKGDFHIAQGTITTGISGAGQVEALDIGFARTFQMLQAIAPILAAAQVPSGDGSGGFMQDLIRNVVRGAVSEFFDEFRSMGATISLPEAVESNVSVLESNTDNEEGNTE